MTDQRMSEIAEALAGGGLGPEGVTIEDVSWLLSFAEGLQEHIERLEEPKCAARTCKPVIPKPTPIKRKARPKTKRGTKRASLVRQCDKLWGEIIRAKGPCIAAVWEPGHVCGGPIQAMHGLSRSYHGTRWNLDNGLPGCRNSHMAWTKAPMRWARFLIDRWGITGYDAMWKQAQAGKPKDMAAVLAGLLARG